VCCQCGSAGWCELTALGFPVLSWCRECRSGVYVIRVGTVDIGTCRRVRTAVSSNRLQIAARDEVP